MRLDEMSEQLELGQKSFDPRLEGARQVTEVLPVDCPETTLRNRSESGYDERILPDDLQSDPLHLARYLFAAHWTTGRSVAEFCCGLGYGAAVLSGSGARHVLGIDVDPLVVEAARQRYGNSDVQFVCADVAAPLEQCYSEVAICFEGIEHLERPENLLMNMERFLPPDGIALISTPNASQYATGHSGNPYHLHEYRLDEFRRLLSKYFKKVDMFFQWNSGDPFDFSWSLRALSKALIPIPVKHFFRSRFGRGRLAPSSPSFSNGSPTPYCSRPFPAGYLPLLPGLRHAQPSIWLAVCTQPRNVQQPDSSNR